MLIGKKISLRALEREDLPLLRDWRNNENFRKYFREIKELNLDNQNFWFDNFVVNNPSTLMFGIIENDSSQLIGVCGLCYINWVHRNADLSMYIGKDDIYIDPEEGGFAWDILDVLFEYAFNRLNIHKMWCEIYEFDEKKHELFNNYGFSQDGVFRDNYFYDGNFMDGHLFTILAHEWREKHRT